MDIRPLISKGFDLWSPIDCPEVNDDDTTSEIVIWDGTGTNDILTDWICSGFGYESVVAKYTGTNGLYINTFDSNGNKETSFSCTSYVDISKYDFFSFRIKVIRWEKLKESWIKVYKSSGGNSREISLGAYARMDLFNVWQLIRIPLTFFGNNKDYDAPDASVSIDKIKFKFHDSLEMCFDWLTFNVGALLTIPVCSPDPVTHEVGNMSIQVLEDIKPNISTSAVSIVPNLSVAYNSSNSNFPKPIVI